MQGPPAPRFLLVRSYGCRALGRQIDKVWRASLSQALLLLEKLDSNQIQEYKLVSRIC